jgi:hypothetical protein
MTYSSTSSAQAMTGKGRPPRVFLIGDSIAAGYAEAVQKRLAGRAGVQLRPENGEDSRNLLRRAPAWLAGERFDVIHFNCGLHDIKRAHTTGDLQVPTEEYERNLYQIVELLRPYARKLIWARITPVMDGQPVPWKGFDRFNRDDRKWHCAQRLTRRGDASRHRHLPVGGWGAHDRGRRPGAR